MRIDRHLNLVIPIEREGGTSLYVHSMPISREVFETYFMPLSAVWSTIMRKQLDVVTGPRVAAMLLRKVAKEEGIWDDIRLNGALVPGVESGLMGEITRLTNVMAIPPSTPTAGWQMIPFYDAKQTDLLSDDEVSEIENAIVFFTCVQRLLRRGVQEIAIGGMTSIWGALATSLSCMEYVNSLPTSTKIAITGASQGLSQAA